MHRQSAIAAAVLLSLSLPAFAQPAPAPAKPTADELERVVVTGIRASLKKALDTKREADSIMDVVTAEDVGKFPATNVAEAITVIPGVTIDKAFGQGEKVSILGTDPALNRTLLNGQAIASGDWFMAEQQGRTFNYSLLAPQLVSKVEVHKSPEARLDEGSIGGTVNIVTRKPLDLKGLTLTGAVNYLYNDRTRSGKPTLSGTLGWKNDASTFGVLVSAQRAEEQIRRDGVESYGTVYGRDYINGRGGSPNSITTTTTDWSQNPPATMPPSCVGACRTTLLANPNAVTTNSVSAHYFDQVRERDTLSLAVQFKPHKKADIEFNALDVKAKYDNITHSMFAFNGNPWNSLNAMTDLTVEGGVITKASFRNALTVYDLINRRATVDTNAYDLKATWKDDGWFASAHAGTSKAKGGTDRQVFGEFLGKAHYNYDLTGSVPKLNFTGYQTAPISDIATHMAPEKAGSPFADASGFRLDGGGPAGGWHTNPPSATNWGAGWGGNIVAKPTSDEEKYAQADFGVMFDSPLYQLRFGVKRREHVTGQRMSGVSLASIKGYGDLSATQFSPTAVPGNYLDGFSDVGDLSKRFMVDGWALADYINSGKWLAPWQTMPVPSTFSDPSYASNTWTVKENVNAAYLQGDFAHERLRGNVGVRVVQTKSDSIGWACTVNVSPCPATAYGQTTVSKKYTNVLPNLNVVYDLNDKVVLRGSAAKVIARPNYGDMSSYLWIGDATLSGGGGNPNLNPYKSTNLDVSAEWYFSSNSILAGTIFHKKVDDYILVTTAKETHYNQNQQRNTEYDISRPANAGSATIQGFSLAYQTAFSNGLGVLANYTNANAKAEGVSRLPFNSKHQVSLSPFYENDRWSARTTYSWRSKYYTQADRGNFLVTDGHESLDASVNFKITSQLTLGLDAMNLMDSEYRSYAEVPGVANTEKLVRGAYRTGRRYMASLRLIY
ncbi:MAG: TonB-dependent receptor [Roseateles sp.]|uniref:TonB-dependent receptor n=1 Tax=Roseateles sp. TaxID=1971397 RepID=UPI00403674DA